MEQRSSQEAPNASKHARRPFWVVCVVTLVLVLVTIGVGTYYYRTTSASLTDVIFKQRLELAGLSASSLKARLDQVGGVAESFASQDAIRTAVENGRWSDAILQVENLSNNPQYYDSFIDRVILIDTSGTMQSAYPQLYGGVGNQDVAWDEWRTPLTTGGSPFYVTNVYKRLSIPRINVVECVAPIIANGSLVGFISLQIPISDFSDFGKNVDIGEDGFVYFFDRLGHLVAHPKYSSEGPIVDFSSVPSVQMALQGKSGVGVLYNPIERQERVSAYELIPGYGWGLVAQEPSSEAFAIRDGVLAQIVGVIIIFCLVELGAGTTILLLRRKNHHGSNTRSI